MAETIAKATYKDADGVERPSPNKWQALYILGQIYDARRRPEQAVAYYRRVADRFTDAAEAVQTLTRKELELPEVTVVRPPARPAVAAARARPVDGGLRLAATPADEDEPSRRGVDRRDRRPVVLTYRNIAEADVKVYPVDLMRLYLTRRNLDGIAGIDLAGITPLFETTVPLDGGLAYDDQDAGPSTCR